MALYMRFHEGNIVGRPVPRPSVIPYTDPGTGEQTTISSVALDDAAMLAIGGHARVDPAFTLSPYEIYLSGGSFDAETGLATPNKTVVALASLKSQSVIKIRAAADTMRAQIADAGPFEIAAWPVKAERARRILGDAGSAEDIAIVQAEATARGLGETVAELALIQQQKALALATVVSVIDGLVKAAEDSIAAAEDVSTAHAVSSGFGGVLQSAIDDLMGGGE